MTTRTPLSLLLPALALAFSAAAAHAGERQHAVAGAVIGGAAGAVIGHEISGRYGAMVGGALGAITGVAVATSGERGARDDARGERDYRYSHGRDDDYPRHRDGYYDRERVIYREVPVVQQRVIYRDVPVVVQRPARVQYVPVYHVVGYRPERDRRHDHKEWKKWKQYRKHHGRDHD